MAYSMDEARKLLAQKAKYPLGFFPTPLHRLDNLSGELGVEIYIKRDDFTGRNLFGGNKIRKLEYVIGDALKQGAEYVFTYGATESNHAMQTVSACRRAGLKPVLYLVALVPVDEDNIRSNLLLDEIMGAEIHIVNLKEGETEDEADERAAVLAGRRMEELRQEGHACYEIPMGAANEIGSSGFAEGFLEATEQLEAMGRHMDYLFHATGTAGTLAGLAAGKKLIGSDTRIIAVNVSKKDDEYLPRAAAMANRVLEFLGAGELSVDPWTDMEREGRFYVPGYEKPGRESTEAILRLSRSEGLLVDPVYSGKAFAGLLAWIKEGKIRPQSTVVFWHTGGATALFAEKEIVGKLTGKLIYE